MRTLLLLLICNLTFALTFKSEGMKLKQEFLNFDLQTVIWGFDFLSKDKIVLTTKKGSLYSYSLKTKALKKIELKLPNLDPKTQGQGGLLDILVNEKQIYITFAQKIEKKYTTTLARFELKNNKVENFKVLYQAKAFNGNIWHYGSRLLIKDNQIYMTIGDRGERDKSQKMDNEHGAVVRLNLDGSSPKDNPFKETNAFTKGHRNPQGITLSPFTKQIITGEFGPEGGDEINLIVKGKNYGWPLITYGEEYGGGVIGKKKLKGMEQPLHYWTPSLSFSGINFYTHDKLSKWKNNLFLACLPTKRIQRVVLDKDHKVIKQEALLEGLKQRIRMVRQSPTGELYFSTDAGRIGYITK